MAIRPMFKNQQGQILIFVALAFILLGMFVGLAVDLGSAYLLQSRLARLVDAAAIAGAKAMPGASSIGEATDLATAAACDSAAVNGIDLGDCGTSGPKVFVNVDQVTNPDDSEQLGVIVTMAEEMATSFMSLGTLIGCGPACQNLTVSALGAAAPDSLVDVVMVVDTTGSMSHGCDAGPTNCPITQLRNGANALVDCLIGSACGISSSNATIGLVPFRACYNSDGSGDCIDDSGANNQIVNLTNNTGNLTTGINALSAAGYTNVCTGINRGRQVLFGSGSRAIARKAIVVLTDGANHFEPGSTNVGGSACPLSSGSNSAIVDLDVITHNMARDIKRGLNVGSSGQTSGQRVEIYVLRYAGCDNGECGDDLPSPGTCDRSLINRDDINNRNGRDNDPRDRNLSRCIASNNSGGDPDPFSTAANDHYFWAANAAAINTGLQEIAEELLKKLRIVN